MAKRKGGKKKKTQRYSMPNPDLFWFSSKAPLFFGIHLELWGLSRICKERSFKGDHTQQSHPAVYNQHALLCFALLSSAIECNPASLSDRTLIQQESSHLAMSIIFFVCMKCFYKEALKMLMLQKKGGSTQRWDSASSHLFYRTDS